MNNYVDIGPLGDDAQFAQALIRVQFLPAADKPRRFCVLVCDIRIYFQILARPRSPHSRDT